MAMMASIAGTDERIIRSPGMTMPESGLAGFGEAEHPRHFRRRAPATQAAEAIIRAEWFERSAIAAEFNRTQASAIDG